MLKINKKWFIVLFIILFGLFLYSCEVSDTKEKEDDKKEETTNDDDPKQTEKPDTEELETEKLPPKFTLKTPGAMTYSSRAVEMSELSMEIVKNNIEMIEMGKIEVALRFLIFDALLADVDVSDTINPGTSVAIEGALKTAISPYLETLGLSVDDTIDWGVYDYYYQSISDGDYVYRFYEEDGTGEYSIEIKWSADKKKVFVKQTNSSDEAAVGEQRYVFTYQEAVDGTESAGLGIWAYCTPEGVDVKENIYFQMSMVADSESTANGKYFSSMDLAMGDTGDNHNKITTQGYADDNEGFIELQYIGPEQEGTGEARSPFLPMKEEIRTGIDTSAPITYSGNYNMAYDTANGWVHDDGFDIYLNDFILSTMSFQINENSLLITF